MQIRVLVLAMFGVMAANAFMGPTSGLVGSVRRLTDPSLKLPPSSRCGLVRLRAQSGDDARGISIRIAWRAFAETDFEEDQRGEQEGHACSAVDERTCEIEDTDHIPGANRAVGEVRAGGKVPPGYSLPPSLLLCFSLRSEIQVTTWTILQQACNSSLLACCFQSLLGIRLRASSDGVVQWTED
eukprot:1461776-Rhodomonas_salina.3